MDNQHQLFSNFESALDQSINDAWGSQRLDTHLTKLEEEAKVLANEVKTIGNTCQENLKMGTTVLADYIGAYIFPEKAKAVLILWRDILFEQQKAEILKLEKKVTPKELKELNLQSKNTIVGATDSFRNFLSNESEQIKRRKGGQSKAIEKWDLQTSPWSTYKQQIEAFPEQCTMLRARHTTLKEIVNIFGEIENKIIEIAGNCENELEKYNTLAQTSFSIIEENISGGDPTPIKISNSLENSISNLEITTYPQILNTTVNELVEQLPEKTDVPVSSEGGILQYKEINFRRSAKQWLDSEILPLMNEICELTENTGNNFKMSLMNISNKAKILSAELKEGKTVDFEKTGLSQPISNFQKKTTVAGKEIKEFKKTIGQRMKEEFNVSTVYDATNAFLPVSIQSTIRQYNRIGQNEFLDRVQGWWNVCNKSVKGLLRRVEIEDQLSTSEKVVRYIKSRTNVDENFYSNIFMTSGYIGDSFLVGRYDELARMKDLIDNWKIGFRGSAAIVGDRFSGKTLFGELVVNRFFRSNVIRLLPNSKVKFSGRHIDTTSDLGEALSFVKKNTVNGQVLVWIDDLELWWNNEIPLNKNVRSLGKFINGNASNVFVMVSMNTWLRKHLIKFHNFEAIFQSEINMNKTSASEVSEAILIRHGATHKTLVKEAEGEEVSTAQLKSMIQRVCSSSNGIMGEALSRWSNSIKKVGEEEVVFAPKSTYKLPDFFAPETSILLSTIILSKRINEYNLRKKFGPAFNEKYKGMLQRLLSMGILVREIDGTLCINPVAVNDIANQLVKKNFL